MSFHNKDEAILMIAVQYHTYIREKQNYSISAFTFFVVICMGFQTLQLAVRAMIGTMDLVFAFFIPDYVSGTKLQLVCAFVIVEGDFVVAFIHSI